MAITVLQEPYEINWSKNPIRYVLKTNMDPGTSGLYLQVAIWSSDFGENNFTQDVVLSLMPDANGICSANLENILDSLVDYFIPEQGGEIQRVIDQVRSFRIKYREVTDAALDQPWTDGNTKTLVKGGLSYEKWQGPNFFISYLKEKKPFLTWQKSGFFAATDQPVYLHFIQSASSAGQIIAEFRIHYTDQTEQTKTLEIGDGSVTPKWSMWCIPAGLKQQALDEVDENKKIQWYEVKISDDSGILANSYRFNPDYRYFSKIFRFNFINSLGGMDSIRILGDWQQNQTRRFDEAERYDPDYFQNSRYTAARMLQRNQVETVTYKGNAGFMRDPDVFDAYRQLMISDLILEQKAGKWLPVLIMAEKTDFMAKSDELTTLPVEWRYAFDNQSYTPIAADLGELPACPIPTGLSIISQGEDQVTIGWMGDSRNNSFIVELRGTTKPVESPWGSGGVMLVDWHTVGQTSSYQLTVDVTHYAGAAVRVKAICSATSSPYTKTLTVK